MRSTRPVLLAEDDEIDRQAVKRCFKELRISNPLAITTNGEEALAYLQDGGKERPCLVLLDLKMPRMNGLEFLRAVKKEEALKAIPIVVFTTSELDPDKEESFKLGAAGFIVKPAEHLKLVEVIRAVDLYWTLSQMPP